MSRIVIAGDFTTVERGKEAIHQHTAFDKEITKILSEADISILNLETPVVTSCAKPILKIGESLKTDEETISYLKESGINVVTLANNHFNDYGLEGINDTIQALKKEGIDFVGGGRNEEELRRILYKEIEDTKIAFLNYCETEFSIQEGYGSNPLSPITLFYNIKEARSNADVIVVIIHGGNERYKLPSPRMQELYRYIVDLGANAVINHHQHYYSGYELYHGAPIYYGIGNFFFDDPAGNKSWTKGYMVELILDNKYISSYNLIPYIQCHNNEICTRRMNKKETEEFQKDIEQLNNVILNEKLLQEKFIKFCNRKKTNYWIDLTPYSNRYMRALCKRGFLPKFTNRIRKLKILNNIRCESHRDVLIESLK